MSKKSHNELSRLAKMTMADAIEDIASIDFSSVSQGHALPLKEILPSYIWRHRRQGQKAFVGLTFYHLHKEFGFKYAGKGIHNTTNLYVFVGEIDK